MKPIYVFLLSLGTGLIGFLLGGGLGLIGGGSAGTLVGVTGGICLTVDNAVSEGLMTETQAEQLAKKIGQKLNQNNPNLDVTATTIDKLTTEASSSVCDKFLTTIKEAIQASP